MLNKIFNYFFPLPESDVQRVIEYVFKYKANNLFETSPLSDQSFNLGQFVLQFGDHDSLCIFKLKGDIVPMFMFNDAGDIFAIRRAVGLVAVSR